MIFGGVHFFDILFCCVASCFVDIVLGDFLAHEVDALAVGEFGWSGMVVASCAGEAVVSCEHVPGLVVCAGFAGAEDVDVEVCGESCDGFGVGGVVFGCCWASDP